MCGWLGAGGAPCCAPGGVGEGGGVWKSWGEVDSWRFWGWRRGVCRGWCGGEIGVNAGAGAARGDEEAFGEELFIGGDCAAAGYA